MRVFSGPTLASETAATTFTLAGKAFTANVAGPSKMSVSVVMASWSIFCCSIHGAPASPRGGLRVSMVTEVILASRSEEHTSELQSPCNLVCRLLLEKKKKKLKYSLFYEKKKKKNK